MNNIRKRIYTSIEFPDGTHMTWDFNPGKCELPEEVDEGDVDEVLVVGIYKDNEVESLIVEWGEEVSQPSGTLLHITTRHIVSPVEAGLRPTMYGYDKIENPYTIQGVWAIN